MNTSREDLPTIAGIASSNDSFDTLVSALSQAGLVDAVNNATGDKLTVFAPTDEAFAKLPPATLNAVLADRDLLQSVLLYHVVSGDVGSDTAKTLSSATTLNGEDVRIKVFEGDIYLNDDSLVTGADVIASNGRIHIIDTVLIPPSVAAASAAAETAPTSSTSTDAARADFQNIAEIASTNGSFDTLVTAASVAGLVPALADESGFITVFAPTDAAFAKLPAATLNSLLANPTQLANVLLYHVVSGDVGSETAKTLSSAATLSGESVNIKVFEGDIYLNDDSKVTGADIIASNGRIHVIDTVLIPPSIAGAAADESSSSDTTSGSSSSARADLPNIAEIASGNGSFDTLVTAASVAGLVPALADESGFITVFAPTDEAFAKLPASTLNSLLANPAALREVLLYHVVSGDVGSDIAATLSTATMLNGEDVRIKVFKDDIYLNDNSKVTTANILASNGKIHVIDTVLIPPSIAGE
ncbi:MAG: fasciclin domain-containing protein [Chloroflexota bacterium]